FWWWASGSWGLDPGFDGAVLYRPSRAVTQAPSGVGRAPHHEAVGAVRRACAHLHARRATTRHVPLTSRAGPALSRLPAAPCVLPWPSPACQSPRLSGTGAFARLVMFSMTNTRAITRDQAAACGSFAAGATSVRSSVVPQSNVVLFLPNRMVI